MALVLTRRNGESIHIGPDIVITMVRTGGTQSRIAIEAPHDVNIVRGELVQAAGRCDPDGSGTAGRAG